MLSKLHRATTSAPKLLSSTAISTRAESTAPNLTSDRANFLHDFLENTPIPQKSIDHFTSIPWTKKILESPTHDLIPFYSRYLNERTGESRFFAQVVNTDTTVPHVLGLRSRTLKPPQPLHDTSLPGNAPDFQTLVSFGRDLESHPGIVNGGFQSVIFDEVMYCAILLHQHNIDTGAGLGSGPRPKHYTLNLMTRFVAPVRAPSDALVRASVVHREGRKWFVKGDIVDRDGKVLTSAESWWLTARSSLS